MKSGASGKSEEKGPSVVESRLEPVEYMPQAIVTRYQEIVNDMQEHPKKFNESDQADNWERLGVAQFYFGIYRQASVSLQSAFDLRKKLAFTRSSARIALLLGSCHYRSGLITEAVTALELVIKSAVKSFPDICCTAYGNITLALLSSTPPKLKEAVENGKKGLELALKVAKGNKSADIVLQLTRILISTYLKVNEFAKAEVLIFAFSFPKAELALLKAGVKFAAGHIDDANSIIDLFLEEKKKDDEAVAIKDEEKRVKSAAESSRKALLLSRATTPEEGSLSSFVKGGARDGGHEEDAVSVSSLDSKRSKGSRKKEKKDKSPRHDADGNEEEKSVSSYQTGVLSESDGDDDSDDENDGEVDNRTKKEKWADDDNRELALLKAREDQKVEKALSKFLDTKMKLDGLLTEAKCIYNLSVLSSRQYLQKDALSKLEAAEAAVSTFLSVQQVARSISGKTDDEAMAQHFLDAPLNVIPLCESLDDTAEPYILLSHILYARAEAHILLSTKSKQDGILVSRGTIMNRVLPGVSNGNDLDPLDSRRSQVYDDEYVDSNVKDARTYLARSLSILDETNLVRDVVSYDTTKEVEKDPAAPKQLDEDGQEIYAAPIMETVTTVLKPTDLSIVVAQKDAYDTLLDMMQGPTHFKRIQDTAVKELRAQYGVKLTDRGTKAHQNARIDYKTQYVSTYHDSVSIRSEIMPLPAKLGRDEVSLWIEWCISASGGLGMGVFGSSFGMPVNKAQLQKEMAEKAAADLASQTGGSSIAGDESVTTAASAKSKTEAAFKSLDASYTIGSSSAFPALKAAARPTDAFLKEVRGRLSEIEGMMSSKFDSSEMLYRPRDKEMRMLVNICLARVTAQLNQKRDCELAVDMMEELAKDLRHRTQNSHDGFYVALSCRYRFEIEEAKVPSGMSTEAMAFKQVELLVFAKEYVIAAEKCKMTAAEIKKRGAGYLGPDANTADILIRDAYKKCINIYVDLAATPVPEKGGKDKNKNELTATLGEEKGTLEMLSLYGESEIEEKEEEGDMTFLRKFGKVRAQQLFLKLKACKGY